MFAGFGTPGGFGLSVTGPPEPVDVLVADLKRYTNATFGSALQHLGPQLSTAKWLVQTKGVF